MKTTTYLKIMLLTLFIMAQGEVFAVTYPAYICGNTTTATLRATATTTAGEVFKWEKVTDNGATVTTVKTSLTYTDKDYVTPSAATLGVGEHTYRVTVISANSCPSDASSEYKIYVLPSSTVTLASPTVAEWCENVSTTSDVVATAGPDGGNTLPQDVGYNFTWAVTKGGTPVTSAGTAVDGASPFTASTFTVNTNVTGTYSLVASTTYKIPSGSVLISGGTTGCSFISESESVIVRPQPGQPSISIVP